MAEPEATKEVRIHEPCAVNANKGCAHAARFAGGRLWCCYGGIQVPVSEIDRCPRWRIAETTWPVTRTANGGRRLRVV